MVISYVYFRNLHQKHCHIPHLLSFLSAAHIHMSSILTCFCLSTNERHEYHKVYARHEHNLCLVLFTFLGEVNNFFPLQRRMPN